jgi:hypothetical protein
MNSRKKEIKRLLAIFIEPLPEKEVVDPVEKRNFPKKTT